MIGLEVCENRPFSARSKVSDKFQLIEQFAVTKISSIRRSEQTIITNSIPDSPLRVGGVFLYKFLIIDNNIIKISKERGMKMFCNNCGKRIENSTAFCPVCGMKTDKTGSGYGGVCSMKEYYRDINRKRLGFFKKSGAALCVIFLLLNTLMLSLLWLAAGEVYAIRAEAHEHDRLIDMMINEPDKLEREDTEELADLFDITEREYDELKARYNKGELDSYGDIKEYITPGRALTLLLSDTVSGGYADLLIGISFISVIIITLVVSAASLLVILATATNCRSLAVWALTLASLVTVPSLLTMLPLFILTFTVEKMIAKNDRIYERYITKI